MMQTPEPTPPFGHPSEEGILEIGHPSQERILEIEYPSQERILETDAYFISYQPHLKELARQLRRNMTPGEVILWQHLKKKQMCGLDFDRQRPIDAYIVDFYCKRLRLAIEVDGSSHDSDAAQQNDFVRQARLESLGVRFLRFREAQVCRQVQTVLQTIKTWLARHPP